MHNLQPMTENVVGGRRWVRNGEVEMPQYSLVEMWLLAAGGTPNCNMPAPPPPPPPPPTWHRPLCA